MEVDEAANHIKELVDPDANIIWGSAFNNDLDGKIRVSVVATGIEAEVGAAAAARQGVRLPARDDCDTCRGRARHSAARAGSTMEDETDVEDTLELSDEMDEGDELLLDSDDVLTAPVGSAPIAPPADEDESRSEAAAKRSRSRETAPCSSACRTSRAVQPRRRSTRRIERRAIGASRSTSRAS